MDYRNELKRLCEQINALDFEQQGWSGPEQISISRLWDTAERLLRDIEHGYNGWTNYETWLVSLWMQNEQSSSEYWAGLAQDCWNDASQPSVNAKLTGHEPFTHEERAVMRLSDALKDAFENEQQEWLEESGKECSVWADLTGAVLQEVNWRQIAEHLIEDVDNTETTEEEEV